MADATKASAVPIRVGRFFAETLRVIIPLLILAAGIGFMVVSGRFKETATKPPEQAGPPRVETSQVTPYDGQMLIESDGLVVPFREIQLTSQVAGNIKRKTDNCRAGTFVEAGTLLLEIDPADYELEVKRLRQSLRQAEISVHEIDVQLENLRELALLAEKEKGLQSKEVQRLTSLVQERVVAQSDLDRARSGEIVSRNAVQQLINEARVLIARRASTRASIELAKTQLEQAKLNLSRTQITAPTAGVVVRDMVEEGAYVPRGMVLAEFEDTSAVEVKCNLMNDEVSALMRGRTGADGYRLPELPVKVVYRQGQRTYEWDGKLSRFDGVGLDETTRTFPCRVAVNDPNGGRLRTTAGLGTSNQAVPVLVRGMYTDVEIEVPTDVPLAVIPRKALQLGDVVWCVRNGALTVCPVQISRRFADSVVIQIDSPEFLAIDDLVVTSPLTTVVDGMPVTDGGSESDTELVEGDSATESAAMEDINEDSES